MSSLPSEVLRDVLLPLDRWTLDDLLLTNRRFLQLIMERVSDVCLREISLAYFRAVDRGRSSYSIGLHDRPEIRDERRYSIPVGLTISAENEDTARLFSEFVQALRSSRVNMMILNGVVFTPELAAVVLQTPIVARELELRDSSRTELTRTQFHEVFTHFSPTFLDLSTCQLRECQVTDELVRALSEKGVVRALFPYDEEPVDGGNFSVTDDAVVAFCIQQDVQTERQERWSHRTFSELTLHYGSFTKDLVKRLVEASSVSKRTKSLAMEVSPVIVADEDLRDFAEHLSYRYRGQPDQWRILNFPVEQHGADAAMRLQIVLRRHLYASEPDHVLILVRALSSDNSFFYESDE